MTSSFYRYLLAKLEQIPNKQSEKQSDDGARLSSDLPFLLMTCGSHPPKSLRIFFSGAQAYPESIRNNSDRQHKLDMENRRWLYLYMDPNQQNEAENSTVIGRQVVTRRNHF